PGGGCSCCWPCQPGAVPGRGCSLESASSDQAAVDSGSKPTVPPAAGTRWPPLPPTSFPAGGASSSGAIGAPSGIAPANGDSCPLLCPLCPFCWGKPGSGG